MKKIISLILCVVILALLGTPTMATVQTGSSSISLPGVSVSTSDFGIVFSGPPGAKAVQADNYTEECNLDIRKISISDDQISLVAIVKGENQRISLPITGKLSSSYKLEHGINSVIVEVNSKILGYEVLLFEIFNDTQEDILLLESIDNGKYLQGVPHIKIYLQNDDGQVYIFERSLPACLSDLKASNYSRADSEKDALLWAKDLVIHNTAIIEDTGDGKSGQSDNVRGLYTTTRQEYGRWFYDSFYIASVLVESYSQPYIEMYHTDVVAGGGAPWYVRFKVEEYTLTQGHVVYGQNPYRYINVKIGFGTGDNTTINRYSHQGHMKQETLIATNIFSMGQSFMAGVIQNSLSSVPYGSTINSVIQTLLTIVPVDKTITFQNQASSLTTGFCSAYGVDLSDYYFCEDTNHSPDKDIPDAEGHYYILQIYPLLEKTSSNTQTSGVVYVHFDVELANEISSNFPPFAAELSYQTS